jgi:argininosuccinate synthase
MNNSWSGEDVKGFSKIFGNQVMIYHKVNSNE